VQVSNWRNSCSQSPLSNKTRVCSAVGLAEWSWVQESWQNGIRSRVKCDDCEGHWIRIPTTRSEASPGTVGNNDKHATLRPFSRIPAIRRGRCFSGPLWGGDWGCTVTLGRGRLTTNWWPNTRRPRSLPRCGWGSPHQNTIHTIFYCTASPHVPCLSCLSPITRISHGGASRRPHRSAQEAVDGR
jgi:hypothetical protein